MCKDDAKIGKAFTRLYKTFDHSPFRTTLTRIPCQSQQALESLYQDKAQMNKRQKVASDRAFGVQKISYHDSRFLGRQTPGHLCRITFSLRRKYQQNQLFFSHKVDSVKNIVVEARKF